MPQNRKSGSASWFWYLNQPPLQDTLRLANEIVSAVSQGANFNAIAQQYSVAGSAQKWGRLGWLSTSQLPQNISDALAKIDVGAVTPPIQQDGHFAVSKNGERKNGQADPVKIVYG